MIRLDIGKTGGEIKRIITRKSGRHFYTISMLSRSVKRELWTGARRTGTPGTGGAGP